MGCFPSESVVGLLFSSSRGCLPARVLVFVAFRLFGCQLYVTEVFLKFSACALPVWGYLHLKVTHIYIYISQMFRLLFFGKLEVLACAWLGCIRGNGKRWLGGFSMLSCLCALPKDVVRLLVSVVGSCGVGGVKDAQ